MGIPKGARSATNSTTNLTDAVSKANVFEGFEVSLFTFKVMLLLMIAVDVLFVGTYIFSTKDLFGNMSLMAYAYLGLLFLATFGVVCNQPRLLPPLNLCWLITVLAAALILVFSVFEYFSCTVRAHFHPNDTHSCPMTFVRSHVDIAVFITVLSVKLSQAFLCILVGHLLHKAIRIKSFDANKHGSDDEDEDVMVVFERTNGCNSTEKVHDAAIA